MGDVSFLSILENFVPPVKQVIIALIVIVPLVIGNRIDNRVNRKQKPESQKLD